MPTPPLSTGRVPLIQATFIAGERIPFKHGKNDIQVCLSPHQFSLERSEEQKFNRIGCGIKSGLCVCDQHASSAYHEIFKAAGVGGSLTWFDPSNVPEGCIASLVRSWLAATSLSDNIGFGFMIPRGSADEMKDGLEFWEATPNGSVVRQDASQLTSVWYVSLSVQNSVLDRIAKSLRPIETFPLIEFPGAIIEESWASRSEVLTEYKVRNEDLIYLDSSHPEAAYMLLSKSLGVIPRGGAFPKTPVITPDGTSKSYMIATLSGAIHDAVFASPPNRVPFPHASGIEGYVMLRRVG